MTSQRDLTYLLSSLEELHELLLQALLTGEIAALSNGYSLLEELDLAIDEIGVSLE